jgi:tRNA pseudouridine38-40 synthase
VILAAEPVGADFEARFSAVRRHYLYRICSIAGRRLTWGRASSGMWRARLDADAMHEAAQRLVGRARFHDLPRLRMSGRARCARWSGST